MVIQFGLYLPSRIFLNSASAAPAVTESRSVPGRPPGLAATGSAAAPPRQWGAFFRPLRFVIFASCSLHLVRTEIGGKAKDRVSAGCQNMSAGRDRASPGQPANDLIRRPCEAAAMPACAASAGMPGVSATRPVEKLLITCLPAFRIQANPAFA